jgi:tetratricopeptide (TPR) repeat protein
LSDRALARAQAVVGIAPRDPRALELLADIHLALDNLDSAADAIERLEAAAPERASHALMLQGMLAEARGEESEAEAKLRAELRRNPSHLETAEALAGLLRRKGRFEEGRALLEETASLEETGPAAWVALGSYCLSADAGGREADAIRAFSRALMADPNHAPALRRLVDAHMARGGLAEALAFAERYLDLRPDDASVWNLKALVLLDLNRDPSKALEAVERAQEVSDRPQYRLTHALILIEMGEEDRAREEVRQAEEAMGPTSAQIDLALAQALLDVGQVDEARHYAGRARTKAEEGQIVNTEQLARLEERIAQEG